MVAYMHALNLRTNHLPRIAGTRWQFSESRRFSAIGARIQSRGQHKRASGIRVITAKSVRLNLTRNESVDHELINRASNADGATMTGEATW